MENRTHAANAKARASEMERKGKLSPGEKAKIDAKAAKILGEHHDAMKHGYHKVG